MYARIERCRLADSLAHTQVFRLLQHALGPDFTEDNWTSELRGLVPGFSPYLGTSLADFRYADTSGVLTNLWFGTKQKKAWKDRWPTYHLEVKTTSGGVNEPFHMSSAQLQLVRSPPLLERCATDDVAARRHNN